MLLLRLLLLTDKSWRYHGNTSPCVTIESIVGCDQNLPKYAMSVYHAKLWW